jgi:hypothetical protein
VTVLAVGCTSHHTDPNSAASISHRHYPKATVSADTRVADVRFAGGPRPVHAPPGPLDSFPDNDRVVRCLVPLTSDSVEVVDIVVNIDKPFVRWTQGGTPDATTQFMPPI